MRHMRYDLSSACTTSASASMRRRRSTAAERAQWVRRLNQSGLSARQFAQLHRLKLSTLQRWVREHPAAAPAPAFAEVLLPDRAGGGWAAELLRPDGARLRLAAHAPAPWFDALLRSC
mgnify:FL=1